MIKNKKIKLNRNFGSSSTGVGIGHAVLFDGHQLKVEKRTITDVEKELTKFDDIILKVSNNIKKLVDTSDIFSAHLMIAKDPVFKNQVRDHIIANKVDVAQAIKVISDFYLKSFDTIYDQHLQERKADILDVTNQMLSVALDVKLKSLSNIKRNSIVFADDLSPSQTANLDPKYIKGIVLFKGGVTSHTSIIAKLHNIPLIINSEVNFNNFKEDLITIIDADLDIIFQNPSAELISKYEKIITHNKERLEDLNKYINKKTRTKDGNKINLLVNIADLEDLELINKYNVDGVGLFRTEFMYMGNELPSEQYQYDTYKRLITSLKGKIITIRTFDIGGDKQVGSIELIIEENPFLGVRGIRLALKYKEVLKTQLRALLRASVYGDIKIMFPMIASIDELLEAKQLVSEVEKELKSKNIEIGHYQIGIMVEVPSVALNADLFAKHVDFFSIGSNDLIQYTFAADRLNSNLTYLYQPLNLGLLKLIEMTANAAKKYNIEISMCGEMAGYNKAIPLLIALGIDNLSMSITNILPTRRLIYKFNCNEAQNIKDEAFKLETSKDINSLMNEFISKYE